MDNNNHYDANNVLTCCYHNVQHYLVAAFFGRKQVAAQRRPARWARFFTAWQQWRRQGQAHFLYFILMTCCCCLFLYNITICCEKSGILRCAHTKLKPKNTEFNVASDFDAFFCYVAAAACDKRQRAPTKRPTAHRRKKSARQISQANARAKCKTALACLPQDAVLCCWFLFFFLTCSGASSHAKMSKSMN